MPRRRIAIVSHTLPPDSNGQALVLERLLAAFDADSCCLVSQDTCPATTLPGEHVRVPPGPRIRRVKPLKLLIDPLQLRLDLRWWSRALERIARERRCDAIVACTGEVYELPAAARAAAKLGVPFIPYIFDWYRYKYSCLVGWHGRLIRRYAHRVEGPMLRSAHRVIVPNETMRDEYLRRHGVESLIVRNPTDFTPEAVAGDPQRRRDELTICYTGAIYQAHFDAFARLLTAIKNPPGGSKARLRLYTDATDEWLNASGLDGPIDRRPRVSLAEVQAVQQRADVLFLPLAFDSPYPEIIRTSAPGKMGDYLASGRPILVHAPADSFVSWYFKKHDCGLVVDTANPNRLTEAIARLAADGDLRRRLAENALRRAEFDFRVEHARAAFAAATGLPLVDGQSPTSAQAA